jgi:hypothetical protein
MTAEKTCKFFAVSGKLFCSLVATVTSFALLHCAQAQEKILTPEARQLQWDGWLVKIDEFEFKSVIERYGMKRAEPDSTFVRLAMTVTNNKNRGEAFIPQNALKIVIGTNEYDAEDLDSVGESYMDNIEPTLVRTRRCYFELPLTQIKDFFNLRFQGFLTEQKTVKVASTTASCCDSRG